MPDETVYELTITATDAQGRTAVGHAEYRTRLSEAGDVPGEVLTELGKAVGASNVRTVNDRD